MFLRKYEFHMLYQILLCTSLLFTDKKNTIPLFVKSEQMYCKTKIFKPWLSELLEEIQAI